MQTIALGWLVLHLSHNSGVAIGAAIALQFVPTLLLGAWAGVLADRFDKRMILVLTAITMGVTAGALAVLTLTGVVALWMVFAIVLLQGIAQSIDNPARLSFVSEMTGPGRSSERDRAQQRALPGGAHRRPGLCRRDHRGWWAPAGASR